MTTEHSDLVKRLRAEAKVAAFGDHQLYAGAADTIEAQSAIISEKNELIDKLEAERETLITELERLLKQLGRKDLSI